MDRLFRIVTITLLITTSFLAGLYIGSTSI